MSPVSACGLDDVTSHEVKEICDRATESHAKSILSWPHGGLGKPEIFNPVDEGSFDSLEACTDHFLEPVRELVESTAARAFSMHALAFVAVSRHELPEEITLVVADDSDGDWRMGRCSVPVEVEVGLSIENLGLGDAEGADVLGLFSANGGSRTLRQYNSYKSEAPLPWSC